MAEHIYAEYKKKADTDAGSSSESIALEGSTGLKIKCEIWQGEYMLRIRVDRVIQLIVWQ